MKSNGSLLEEIQLRYSDVCYGHNPFLFLNVAVRKVHENKKIQIKTPSKVIKYSNFSDDAKGKWYSASYTFLTKIVENWKQKIFTYLPLFFNMDVLNIFLVIGRIYRGVCIDNWHYCSDY